MSKRLLAAITLTALASSSPAPRAHAQTNTTEAAASTLSFEVATIKPSKPGVNDIVPLMGHRVVMPETTVQFLLAFAYDVHVKQIANGPSWLASDKFDLDAVSSTPGTPSLPQLKLMLQKLLADHFQLQFHRETRPLSAYALTLAQASSKSGPKLAPSKDDPNALPSLRMQPGFPKIGVMQGRNVSMADFAQLLQSGILDRPVLDHTALPGRYDFNLQWTPDTSQFTQVGVALPEPTDSAEAPSLFTALQEQLGLKLTAERNAPTDVLVVDRLTAPSAN